MCEDSIETTNKMLFKKLILRKIEISVNFSFHKNLKRHFRKKCKRQEKREAKERMEYKKKKKMERRKNWEKGKGKAEERSLKKGYKVKGRSFC